MIFIGKESMYNFEIKEDSSNQKLLIWARTTEKPLV